MPKQQKQNKNNSKYFKLLDRSRIANGKFKKLILEKLNNQI